MKSLAKDTNLSQSSTAIVSAAVLVAGALLSFSAEAKIYRCGNEYTNDAQYASQKGCKVVTGGNVTIVQNEQTQENESERPYSAAAQLKKNRASLPSKVNKAQARRVSNAKQLKRDNETRLILNEELRQAKDKLATMNKEYNNGQPERWGSERNYQKYLDRVAKMREDINRQKEDIQGLEKEIDRLPSAATM